MKVQLLLIEGYCDGKEGEKDYHCKGALTFGIHCLECSQFSYTKCPNVISVSNDDGLIKNQEDFVGFGGEMEPNNIEKRDECISIWMDICKKKINEAYDEYMSYILHKKE